MAKIICEISSNHGGSLSRCLEMIMAAKWAGCWAAKFQFYKPEDLPDFDPKVNLPVPCWWLPYLFKHAKQLEIELFASVFAGWAINELAPFTNLFKIASPESTRLSDATYDALGTYSTCQFLVSSGKADFWKMRSHFWSAKTEMLYCKAGYPATIDDNDIELMANHAAGFSDHTEGISAALAMVGAGAKYIEKHFKLDDNCVDAAFSLNPEQMKTLCDLA